MKKIKSVEGMNHDCWGRKAGTTLSDAGCKPCTRFLRFDLLFIVVGVSLLVILTLALVLYLLQNRQLVRNAQTGMKLISDTVEINLEHAMISRDMAVIEEVVKGISAEPRVESIKILNDQGGVAFSSNAIQIGEKIKQTNPQCQLCHATGDPSTNKSFVYKAESGHEVLLNVNLIENRETCYQCHEPENEILGLIVMEMSLAGVYDQFTASFWRSAILASAALLLLVLLIVPALEKRIIRPVRELTKGMAAISNGDLNYVASVVNQDELGDLANSFDRMRIQLKITLTQRNQNEKELAILYQVGQTASQLHDLQAIMDFTLNIVVNKLGLADSLIFLWDESLQYYTLRAYDGISPEQVALIEERRRAGYDFIQQVADADKELFVPNLENDKRVNWTWENQKERSYISFPLKSRGKVVGVMEAVTQNGHILSAQEVEFLKAIGQQIGSAIDNELLLENQN